tara:strand:+ start:5161 stop:5700 length:540 start_codon:yes stop_codon:yes gene_type:complete
MEAKKTLRRKMLLIRNGLSLTYRNEESQKICKELIDLISKTENKYLTVHCFLHMLSEVNINLLIEWLLQNKIKVIAPKTLSKRKLENRILTSLNEVENGVFGTTHPTSNKEYTDPIDLCIVPGAAFDKSLSRLGYGGGYYDTFLANYPNAEKVAVCFKEQFVESVPTESHDVKMNKVVC